MSNQLAETGHKRSHEDVIIDHARLMRRRNFNERYAELRARAKVRAENRFRE